MKHLANLLLLCAFLLTACQQPPLEVDLLITGGEVIDGTGAGVKRLDIGIRGDSIAFLGKAGSRITAAEIIDATGYIVAPGFIDPHTHADGELRDSARSANLNYLTQGVTTVFVGSDGRSAPDIAELFSLWEKQGIGTNAATFVGHASTRRRVMGMRDDAPTPEELENMKTIVRRGMEAGAIGLSSGLYYAPASYATTEEVIELARVAAEYGGNYDVHIRDESSYNIGVVAAVEETIEIAEKAGLPGNVSHIKCLGVDVWGLSDTIIQIVNAARERGVQVTADQYPWNASGTSITGALVPRWVLADDPDPRPKFQDPALRPRIVAEMQENMRRRGGPETLLLTFPNEKNKDLTGKTLAEVAEMWGMDPIDAAIEVLMNGGSSLGSFNMQEEDMVNFMQQEWVMTSSDGSSGHPRKYGSFPKKIREYVLEKGVLDLPTMVHRSSGLTATTFGLDRRGFIREGYLADLIIFKPEEIRDNATFTDPTALSTGMHYVLVNGQVAIREGEYTGALAGKAVK